MKYKTGYGKKSKATKKIKKTVYKKKK